ncbi:hypothetical protein FRC04_007855 [Tulasnella sp. 424]|nr:hypothetical protein FRC04_007855 [Tulasnella sp. 424]KAG8975039.1 hypothetical protein FRC05_006462 [Tulasnella sp. 425]
MQRCYNTNLFSVKRLPIGPQCGSRTLLQSIHSAASTSPSPGFTATSPTSRPSVSSLLPTRQHPALRPPCNPRSFTSSSQLLAHHFDTHKFVRRLETEGLTRQQAEGIMNAIESVMDESIRNMSSGFVTKAAQEKQHYTQQVDFAQLKSEVQLVEKNDISLMKAENDRLSADLEKLKARLREEITRTQAGVRLDLNLEKGRIRDETSIQELKLREVETRIESEMAGLRTAIETAKQNTLQYLVTVATGCAALLMAYLRFRY